MNNLNDIDGKKYEFIVFEMEGLGEIQSPWIEGKTKGIFTGTEEEVKSYCEQETLKIHGKLTGWDSPTIQYKIVTRLN